VERPGYQRNKKKRNRSTTVHEARRCAGDRTERAVCVGSRVALGVGMAGGRARVR
jgi:hypothetical protein